MRRFRKRGGKASRQNGLTLVEVAIALSVVTVVATAALSTTLAGMQHRRQSSAVYDAVSALRDLAAEMQEIANLPEDVVNGAGVGALYTVYGGLSRSVPDLEAGQITITCFANETAVPALFGGPQDLNFDGDAGDDLTSLVGAVDLRLVPATLVCTFTDAGATHTVTLDRLFANTAD